jgi:protein TonB
LQEYICKVKTGIERRKNYPQIARKEGIEGVVRVQFCIAEDGRLKWVTVVDSSGCPILDNEAIISVRKASPFLRIPEELKKKELDLRVNIAFKLEG